jgi:effector-binding domain-containing protein
MNDAVRIVTTPPTPTAVIAASTTWDEFPELWGSLIAEVWTFLRGSDLAAGRNVMLYKDDVPNVEVGAEVGASFVANGRVEPSSLPAGEAATTVVRGAPSAEGLGRGHELVLSWCAEKGRELTGVRWEVYGHWLEDQDPSAYEIEVFWLLAP